MTKKNIFIRLKWLWIACGAAVLAVLCFFAGKMIYIKSADTSWQDELGYNENEIYHLKQDRVGCPYQRAGRQIQLYGNRSGGAVKPGRQPQRLVIRNKYRRAGIFRRYIQRI